MALLSFHNDPAIKDKYVARLKAHAKADEFIKGKYWENGKGCAVGCTIHSSSHNAYETELGIPEWLAQLEDRIFEGLDNGDAKKFAVDFLISIPVGANLEPIKWKFCAFILKENIERVLNLTLDNKLKREVIEAIQKCLAVHEDAIQSGQWDESAARSAANAAIAAASAARSAASAASAAASAASAAWSAERSAASAAIAAASAARSAASAAASAASAAWSAAWSAASAARSAAIAAASAASAASAAWSAESAEYKHYADELLRLLAECVAK